MNKIFDMFQKTISPCMTKLAISLEVPNTLSDTISIYTEFEFLINSWIEK